jgi:hypothetical protein
MNPTINKISVQYLVNSIFIKLNGDADNAGVVEVQCEATLSLNANGEPHALSINQADLSALIEGLQEWQIQSTAQDGSPVSIEEK